MLKLPSNRNKLEDSSPTSKWGKKIEVQIITGVMLSLKPVMTQISKWRRLSCKRSLKWVLAWSCVPRAQKRNILYSKHWKKKTKLNRNINRQEDWCQMRLTKTKKRCKLEREQRNQTSQSCSERYSNVRMTQRPVATALAMQPWEWSSSRYIWGKGARTLTPKSNSVSIAFENNLF